MLTAIKAGQLFDGTGSDPTNDAVVLVVGDRIDNCGPAEQITIPEEAMIIDCGDEFVMPGIIDAHTHITIIPGLGNQIGQMRQPATTQLIRGLGNLRRNLKSGVTTARIMAEERFLDVEIKEAIEAGQIPGPNLLVSCRPITPSNGHGRALSWFDGPDEVRRAARENLAAGADFLKLFLTGGVSSERGGLRSASYTAAEIRAATEEAERVGTYAAAHAHGGPGIQLGVEHGVRTIEHGLLASDEDLAVIGRHGAWVVLTSSILLHPTGIEQGDAGNPQIMAKVHQARAVAEENLPRIIGSGVNYSIGTDSMHGLMPFEMECLVRYGASNREALLAATARAAEVCQIADQVGTIEVGKKADIISVPGNPLADITAMRSVSLILKGGERFDHLSDV
jgi:imidazolonepropionase-like amidohydrolase